MLHGHVEQREAGDAGLEDLLRVHAQSQVDTVREACLSARAGQTLVSLDADTKVSPASWDAALGSAGAAISGAADIVAGRTANGFVAARPPGHHATPGRAMGFCLFNSIAVTARWLQAHGHAERVLIVDWDVHHGNGTQEIFQEDPTVFFFSIHENPSFLYPGTGRRWETGRGAGEGTTLNAPMPPGAGDDEYRLAFERMLAPAVERFRPELLLVSAGFDAHRDDPLADMQLTEEGFRFMTRFLVTMANAWCGGRIVSVLEGGYERQSLTRCVEIHLQELLAD